MHQVIVIETMMTSCVMLPADLVEDYQFLRREGVAFI
jgi:hypothetical protein